MSTESTDQGVSREDTERAVTVLTALHAEQWTRVFHYQNQRSNLASIILILSGGILAGLSSEFFKSLDWLFGIALILLGLFGARFTSLHHRQVRECIYFAEKCQERLARLTPLAEIPCLEKLAKAKLEKTRDGLLSKLGDNINVTMKKTWYYLFGRNREYISDYWIIMQISLALVGIVVLARSLIVIFY